MAEFSRFFDSEEVEGIQDRIYNSADFASYFRSFISNGVNFGDESPLLVAANGAGEITIQTGKAYINGRQYQNTEVITKEVLASSAGTIRKVAVVLRLSTAVEDRSITVELIDGAEAGAAPLPQPVVTQTETLYEMVIAYLEVSQTGIVSVTDARTESNFERTLLGEWGKGVVKWADTDDETAGVLNDKLEFATADLSVTTSSGTSPHKTKKTVALKLISDYTAKTTPVDADLFRIGDSAASGASKKTTWANIKATLKTYFDTLYQAVLVSGTNIKTINSSSILGSGNIAVEPTIATGTTAQYWRGDKSWQTLDKTAVGLSNVTNDVQLKVASNLSDVNNQQTALNNITAVSGATNEYVLTKDTSTGNATWKASQGGETTLVKLQEIYGLLANQNGVNYTGTLNNNTITVHTTAASSKSFFNFSFTNTTTTAQTISLLVDDIVVYREELNAGENRNLADVLHQPYFVADTTIKVQSTSTTIDYNINVIDVLDSDLTGFFMLVGNTTGSEQTLKTAGASTKIKLLGEVFSNTDTVNRTITTKVNDKLLLQAQTIGVNQGCLAMLNQGKTINSSQTYKITSSSTNVKYLVFGYEG